MRDDFVSTLFSTRLPYHLFSGLSNKSNSHLIYSFALFIFNILIHLMTREILVYPVNGYKNNEIIESNTVIDTNKRVLSLERYS
jgi:hypothetical protein